MREHIDPAVAAVHAALRAKGSSVRAWALCHGYRPRTVYTAIERWTSRTDRAPLGGLSREIREALRDELGDAVIPPVRSEG